VITVRVKYGQRVRRIDALLDTGADYCVFAGWLAAALAIDLADESAYPRGFVGGLGNSKMLVSWVDDVVLQLGYGVEKYRWRAAVAFVHDSTADFVLGFAGFLQYFDTTFAGGEQRVELQWNHTCRSVEPSA
jgi:hypothetical protein